MIARIGALTLTILLLGLPAVAPAAERPGTLTVQSRPAPPTIAAVTLEPASVLGGANVTGHVTLSGPAPAGGAVVQLSSSHPAVAYAASQSVTVPVGERTRSFAVTTVPVGQSTTVTIAAFGEGGSSRTALLNVRALIASITLARDESRGGYGVGGRVGLFAPAARNVLVQLSSSHTGAATVPPAVTVPAGATSTTFTIIANPVAQTTTATITATVDGVSKTATLTVRAPALDSFVLSPTAVVGGTEITGEVGLDSRAPQGGFVVQLSRSAPAMATPPASVTIAASAETARFTVATAPVARSAAAIITAPVGGASRTRQLTVTPPVPTAVTLASKSVVGGKSVAGQVALNGKAPAGGLVVKLASSDRAAATVPASVTVQAGAMSAGFAVTTTPVKHTTTVTITAASGETAKTASLAVTPQ